VGLKYITTLDINFTHGAEHYFFIGCRLVRYATVFPFPISTAQFIGEFWSNRQSEATRCRLFAYSLMSFIMLCQYFWCRNSSSSFGASVANRKNTANSVISWQTPHFASKCRVQFCPYWRNAVRTRCTNKGTLQTLHSFLLNI
jgi:hypothetical protein